MNDLTRNPEHGPDQAFDARMVRHQKASQDASERLKAAKEALEAKGGMDPTVEEYAAACAQVAGLNNQGDWLLAAQSTLDVYQQEAIASVQENLVLSKNQDNTE